MDAYFLQELIKKYGKNSISYQACKGDFDYFVHGSFDGCILYKKVKRNILVIGDPLISEDDFFGFVHEFRSFCKRERYNCGFLSITELCQKKLEIMDFGVQKIGEEAIMEIPAYSFSGHQMKSNRNYIARAKKEGLTVMHTTDEKIFKEIKTDITKSWVQKKKIGKLGFLLDTEDKKYNEDETWFIAKQGERAVGYIVCLPIYGRNGIYFEHIIKADNAPIGTNQYMIYEAIEALKTKGYTYFSLGLAPLSGIDEKMLKPNKAGIINFIKQRLRGVYNFEGIYAFKKSMYPTTWESKYFAYYPKRAYIKLIFAILHAYLPSDIHKLLFSQIKKIFRKK